MFSPALCLLWYIHFLILTHKNQGTIFMSSTAIVPKQLSYTILHILYFSIVIICLDYKVRVYTCPL